MKAHCFDLIEGALADMPRVSRHEEDIKKAETMNALARVVCSRLSELVSYDFFQKVITHFQPALKGVDERLKRYEDQLKPLLLQNWKTLQSSRNIGYGNHDNHDVNIILLLYTYVYMLALCYYVCMPVYCFSGYCDDTSCSRRL